MARPIATTTLLSMLFLNLLTSRCHNLSAELTFPPSAAKLSFPSFMRSSSFFFPLAACSSASPGSLTPRRISPPLTQIISLPDVTVMPVPSPMAMDTALSESASVSSLVADSIMPSFKNFIILSLLVSTFSSGTSISG